MKSFMRCLAAACLLLCAAFPALSQSRNTGEIRGTVTDPSGSAISGATVTITNVDTGVTSTYTTNANGLYDTVSTQAGNYNITFTAPGFKKLTRGPFTLQIDVITEDGQLEVGAVTDTVTVEAQGAPVLETETGRLGTIFEAKTIGVLPQIGAGITGNDWANFNVLLPGAAGAPSQPMSEGSGSYNAGDAISINGNLPNYANYLLDGAVVQLPVSNNVDNLVFAAVQEVQVTTSSFSAEYGIGGAVFNQISKSGSNGFHGSAYEFWQNNILNAAPYFQTPGAVVGAPYLRYDEWGGSIGGPIIKNKLFFYFVRDKIYNNGASSPHVSTVPTLAERGMGTAFPGDYDFTGNPTIYEPNTRASAGAASTPFPNNVIPGGAADPVALKLLGYYPLPNTAGTPYTDPTTHITYPGDIANNYIYTSSAPNPNLRYFGRIDFDYSSTNRMTFSIAQKNNNGQNFNATPCPLNCFSGDIDGYNVQYSDTWTISPNFVNEFRMGYTKQGNWFVPQTIGFDNAGTLGLQYAKADVFPNINITGYGAQPSQLLQPGTNAIYIENLYDPSDTMTLVKGRHVLHFGIEVLMGQGNTTPWGNVTAGNFAFNGSYTALNGNTTSGSGLADFILGDVENWAATNQQKSYTRLKSPQAFVQDDFKVKPNLTINLGLRWVGSTGFTEINNALGGFDPNLVNYYNGSLGSMWFAGQNNRNSVEKPIWDIFLPRIGFAYSWRPDTVIRGGFGMYSYNYSQDTYLNGSINGAGALTTSTGTTTDPNSGTGPNPLINLDASAATANSVLTYVVGSPNARNPNSYCCTPGVYSSQTFALYNVRPAQINEWQLSVEHQLGKDMMVSAAYVGSHGYHLQYTTDLNQITNPTLLAEGAAANSVIQANRPYPLWGNLTGSTYNGLSNYDALQLALNKHFSNGLLFSVNYVWSHFLDDQDSSGWGSRGGTQTWQIGNDPASNYGNSNFDIPQAVKAYASYDLPFGNGKQFANSVSKPVDAAIGGWRIAGTMVTQSGNPFTIVNSVNNSYSGCSNGCSQFPDRVGNPRSNPGASPGNGTIQWLNTTAFAQPAPGTFGDNGRNNVFGPRLTVFNFSIAKQFSFTERVKLELRSDWVNVFNHPSFGPPSNTFGAANFGVIGPSAPNNGITVAPRSGQLSAVVTF
ncbi:MAG: carboxypeptidase-like regulatory domain-containing protein [Candidatus Acidiferrales bacterium]